MEDCNLGSTRDSRVGEGDPPSRALSEGPDPAIHCGESPQ